MRRRTLFAGLPALMLGIDAMAQTPAEGKRRIAVMSLVSDELNWIGATMSTGSNVNRNRQVSQALSGAPFDRTIMEVLAGRVPHADPGAELVFLAASDKKLYKDQEDWFDGGKTKLPQALLDATGKEGVGWLLLATKLRREASVSDGHNFVGTGKFYGLGVYMDGATAVQQEGEAEEHMLLATYACVRLSLIDLTTSTQVRHYDIVSSRIGFDRSMNTVLAAIQSEVEDGVTAAVDVLFKAA